MSDHDFDEDHNYYTRSNRQSQIPDYDVTQLEQPSSANLQTLPAFAYRQSQAYSPKRPTVDTNVDRNFTSSSAPRPGVLSNLENSPDPHEFYRQYRDSFIRHPGSVYGSVDPSPADSDGGMTAARLAQRNPQSTNRSNGYTPSPVTSRWSNRFEARNASSPLSEKGSTASSKIGTPNVHVPRGRQTSLQALVNKFNSTPDETPPIPSSKTSSRSPSANKSPSTAAAARSFRTRANLDSSHTGQNAGAIKGQPRQLQNPRNTARRKISEQAPTLSPIKSPRSGRRTSAISNNAFASHSMTDLTPPAPHNARRPLFGEILHASANAVDPGFGIPHGRRRRGSEGSMHQPSPMFEEESNNMMLKVSPSSPTAWYMGVTPTLDGIDLDKPVPAKPQKMHRRSRSDFGASGGFTMAPLPTAIGKTITVLPPPLEQLSPTSPTTTKRTSQSRIPISTSRRMSVTSDSGNSTASPGPQSSKVSSATRPTGYRRSSSRAGSTLPTPIPPKTPDHISRASTPRKSPRYRNTSPPRQPSPRLTAYIAEQAPLKSPPLRSSRPRQPVSAASTAASRARAAANGLDQGASQKDKPPKKVPEVGTVNLAARRQMITRAFTKSMIEREEETRKRLSYFNEMKQLEELQAKRSAMTSQANDDSSGTSSRNSETPPQVPLKDHEHLTVDTSQREGQSAPSFIPEDSPTLGSAGFITTQGGQQDDSTPEPGSAVTSGSVETFFENEPQASPPEERSASLDDVLNEGSGSVVNPDQTDHTTPRKPTQSILSEGDDGESIQIMLGDSPIMERLRSTENYGDAEESGTRPSQDHWQSRDYPATLERISEQNTPQTSNGLHSSMSTTESARDELPWSPDSVSSLLSGHTTLDSESYNTINHVLDAYHNPNLMSPENMSEIQRRIFSQSPGLARAGGWDPSKVTQLYLQKYRKSPDLSAVPKPLNLRSGTYNPLASTESHERPERDSRDATEGQNASDVPPAELSPTPSLGIPSATMNLNRASLNNPEDWLNTSPSMLDWITRQAMDTPNDERGEPIARRPIEDGSLDTLKGAGGRSLLPDIPRGGLGILDVSDDQYQPPGGMNQQPPAISEIYTSPTRKVDRDAQPMSPTRKPVQPRTSSVAQPRTIDSFVKRPLGDAEDESPPASKRRSEVESLSTTEVTESERPSLSSEAPTKASSISSEQLKKLTRRKNIIKEMVDTESSFGQDMTVVVDIYKGTSNVVLNSAEDTKVLFGNSHEIVAFSMGFLDALKYAAKGVYVLPKSKRWKSKRDSSATMESSNTDDMSIGGNDLTDEDRDRQTTIGAAFLENIGEMERVYTEYLKNHQVASDKLIELQKLNQVQVWLKECRAYAHDLTTAWNLDSLLVKPVQRILKYPLLMKELVDVTPENHPDFVKLDFAARELVGVSKRINEAKRRADLVSQVNESSNAPKKKEEKESRLAFTKPFSRKSDKVKQQAIGVIENFHDKEYDRVSERFGSHFFQLQVVMRDIEMYVEDITKWVDKFHDMACAIDGWMDVNNAAYPELESKWRKFRVVVKEMQTTALTDHVAAVRRFVIEPILTLLKLHDGPQKLMEKRKKRIADYVKYKQIKDRGEKPDKKTIEQGEQFQAVNDTLKDELPKLFALTSKLVEACLNNFVQQQLQWTSVWKRKMIQAIQLSEIPKSFGVIPQDHAADFRYIEAQVLSLGVCNKSILADDGSYLALGSTGTSIGGSTLHEEGSRRPSGAIGEEYRSRAPSSAAAETLRGRGLSAQGGLSPMLPSPDLGRSTDGFALSVQQSNVTLGQPTAGLRLRASSSASSRSPVTPDMPGGWRNQPNGPQPVGSVQPPRPSTSTGRSYDSFSRPSGDAQRLSAEPPHRMRSDTDSSRFLAPREAPLPGYAPPGQRHSGVFNSAMPMSDSPRPNSPVREGQPPQDYNVLFLAASVYEFNIDRARREAGYPYLTYVAGEIFDVIGEKGELWLAKNQDDEKKQVGWIWNKHFAKLAS